MMRALMLILLIFSSPLHAGLVELHAWNPASPFKLTTGWDFYWQTWLQPQNSIPAGLSLDKELCWQKVVDPATQERFSSNGYGSFHITFRGLTPRRDGYEIFLRSAATAYRAYLYPEGETTAPLIFTNGIVGETADTSVPQPFPTAARFYPNSRDQVWHLIIQVSNFHHYRGGLWQPPEIGPGDLLSTRNRHEREGFIFSIATVLIIGIYNFMIFVRRRRDYSSLSLAFFCAVVAIRAFVTSDLLSYFFPQPLTFLYNVKYAIEYTTIVLGPISYGAFVHFSFHDNARSRLLNFQIAFSLLICLFILITSPEFYTHFVLLYQAIGMLIVVEYLYLLSRAMYRRNEGATLAFSGTCLLSAALIYDILVQHSVVPPPFLSQYGVGAFVFLQSQVVATRFALAFNTAERLSRDLRREVDRQTANIRSLMDHVPLGIFTIERAMTIGKAYSTQLEDILGQKDLNERPALAVMFEGTAVSREQLSIIQSSLVAAWGEPLDFWGLNAAQLPTEYNRQGQVLEVDWHPIVDKHELVQTVLVTVRNVTQLRQLKDQAARREQDIQLLTEMIQVDPKHLHRFWREAEALLAPLRSEAEGRGPVAIARDLHSLKGLARSLGLRQLTTVIHDAEDLLLGSPPTIAEQKRLIEGIGHLFQAYQDLFRQRLAPLDASASAQLVARESLEDLEKLWRRGNQPEAQTALRDAVKTLLCRYVFRGMDEIRRELGDEGQKLAQQLGKAPFVLSAQGPTLFLHDTAERNLRNALLHLLRNALDHGFLPAGQRIGDARIEMDWRARDAMMEWTWRDNGLGLNLKELLRRKNPGRVGMPTTRQERLTLAETIFEDGISTAAVVSEVSGRGIGMSAARSMLENLGGSLHIELLEPFDQDRQRFALHIRLPMSHVIEG